MSLLEKNRISVALCTYNGERFLPKQLSSILDQTRPPDEVVICDDCSRDLTLQILHDFAMKAPFCVRIFVNQQNLGSTKNFERSIGLCTGDLIALSDQDDIWYPSRLARSEQELAEHPDAGLVFTDADVIDDHDRLIGSTLWQSVRFNAGEKQKLQAGVYSICVSSRFVTGATVMFRSCLRDLILPVGEGWIHDEWIAAATPLFAGIRPIEQSLIYYRKHVSQQVGTASQKSPPDLVKLLALLLLDSNVANREHWIYREIEAKKTKTLCDHFERQSLEPSGTACLAQYKAFIDHILFRLHLPKNRFARCFSILGHLHQYSQYEDWRQLLKDLISRS